jgi:hypothetical protein
MPESAIFVQCRKGWPAVIRAGRHTWPVQKVIDYWVIEGRWWAGPEKRIYFRVDTEGGVLEVYRGAGEWVLTKRLD